MNTSSKNKTSGSTPRVLIADDSRVMRVALKKILTPDFEVVDCVNGAEAWQIVQSDHSIQVVFTDLSMPEMDGTALLAAIRGSNDERVKNIPVIVITGKDDDETTKNEILALGANDFVTKPFNSVHITARARSYITHRQTSEKLNHTEAKLATETTTDPATGLGSLRYLETVATKLIAQFKRHGGNWAWVRLDIDEYKDLYLKHGKAASTVVQQKVGAMIGSSVREGDHAVSLGAGKFILILQSTDIRGASKLGERLRTSVKNSQYLIHSERVHLTASIGICAPPVTAGTNIQEVLAHAQQSVDQARQAGGNCVKCITAAEPTPVRHEALSVSDALILLKQGRHDELLQNTGTLMEQIMPLLRVILPGAHTELDALMRAARSIR